MPMNKPAKDGNAGQYVDNGLMRSYNLPLKEQFTRPMPQTLGDVISSMQKSEEKLMKKKLTFDEWFPSYYKEAGGPPWPDKDNCQMAWNAAQENM